MTKKSIAVMLKLIFVARNAHCLIANINFSDWKIIVFVNYPSIQRNDEQLTLFFCLTAMIDPYRVHQNAAIIRINVFHTFLQFFFDVGQVKFLNFRPL